MKIEPGEFRRGLAKDLKTIRKTDPEAAVNVLKNEEKTREYQLPRVAVIEGRNKALSRRAEYLDLDFELGTSPDEAVKPFGIHMNRIDEALGAGNVTEEKKQELLNFCIRAISQKSPDKRDPLLVDLLGAAPNLMMRIPKESDLYAHLDDVVMRFAKADSEGYILAKSGGNPIYSKVQYFEMLKKLKSNVMDSCPELYEKYKDLFDVVQE